MTIAFAPVFPTLSETETREGRPTHRAELLLRAAEWRPRSSLRFVRGGTSGEAVAQTYSALLAEASAILGGLEAYQRGPGEKVGLLLERPRDFIPAFWASVLRGYVPCPLVPIKGDPARFASYVSHADALLDHPLLVGTRRLRGHLAALPVREPATSGASSKAACAARAPRRRSSACILVSARCSSSSTWRNISSTSARSMPCAQVASTRLLDLEMPIMSRGGRERSADEYLVFTRPLSSSRPTSFRRPDPTA